MRYLKDDLFRDRHGNVVLMPTSNSDTQQSISVGAVVKLILSAYVPNREVMLSLGEWRYCQQCLDILDASSDSGWFAFEDAAFTAMGRAIEGTVMGFLIPRIVQNGPQLVDLLKAAPSRMPNENGAKSPAKHKAGHMIKE